MVLSNAPVTIWPGLSQAGSGVAVWSTVVWSTVVGSAVAGSGGGEVSGGGDGGNRVVAVASGAGGSGVAVGKASATLVGVAWSGVGTRSRWNAWPGAVARTAGVGSAPAGRQPASKPTARTAGTNQVDHFMAKQMAPFSKAA